MTVNITFGECLTSILKVLNLKSSKLAKEMNIDSSLVYKWLRNERVPSYDTHYIEQIVEYIIKRINNTYQKEELLNLFIKYGIELSDTNGARIADLLRIMLFEAQGYSIKQHRAVKQNTKRVSGACGHLNGIDIRKCSSQNEGGANDSNEYPEMLFSSDDCIQIVKGRKWIFYAEIELLKQAAYIKPSSGNNTILITYNSEIDSKLNDDIWRNSWINALYNVLSSGWSIVFQVMLGNNTKREMKLIETLQILISWGNIKIYYQKFARCFHRFCEEYIVPGIGALFCFSSVNDPQLDRAFWYHSRESINILTEFFTISLNSAKPLLKSYPHQMATEFQLAFVEAEEILGDKYVFKDGLSTVTMPVGLYEKYHLNNGNSNHEISYRVFLHKRRVDTFIAQVKYYKCRDICFSESLERLVEEREYPSDENYIPENGIFDTSDIVSHLNNVIDMLQKYDNYELAIISKKQFGHWTDINWTVKDGSCVLIECGSSLSAKDNYSSDMNFTITEKSVAIAFSGYFHIIWDQLPEKSKNKAEIIKRLKGLIKKAQQQENGL